MSSFRQQIRDYYARHALPPEKVADILHGKGAAPRRPWWGGGKAGLALAAMLLVLAGLGAWWTQREAARASFAALAPTLIDFFAHETPLPKHSPDPAELKTWLVTRGAPAELRIPARLRGFESYGCNVLDVGGRPAFLTCFRWEKATGEPATELVHLLVTRTRDFRGAPAAGAAQYRELQGWSFASWREDGVCYTLAAAAPLERLRTLVATLAPLLLDWWEHLSQAAAADSLAILR